MRDKFEKHRKITNGKYQHRECLTNSQYHSWEDKYLKDVLEIMKEETIFYSFDNAKTPKEKRPACKQVHVKFEEKWLIFFITVYVPVSSFRET